MTTTYKNQLFSNNAKTLLAGVVEVADTTIHVMDASIFPTPDAGQFFMITLDNGVYVEIVEVHGKSGNALTGCVRGREGTYASIFSFDTRVENRFTAETASSISTDLKVLLPDSSGVVPHAILADTVPWSGVTGTPSTYPPSTHNHDGVYQPLDGDLTAIAGIATTSGIPKKTAADTWIMATAGIDYITSTGVESLTNKTITATSSRETRVAMAANDVDLSQGNYFTKTISGATTLTVSNVPASGIAANFVLDLTNGGSAVITWWSGVKWTGGIAPVLTASGRDVLVFYTHDGGTTWVGLDTAKDVK